MEKDEEGMQRSDISFCKRDKPFLMATAISARVDLYKLTQPSEVNDIQIQGYGNIYKFKAGCQINCFDFKDNMREFVTAANDLSMRYYSILENECVFTLNKAHSDNIKKVQYLPQDMNYMISGSADKTVKLWDLRNYSLPLDSMKFAHSIEDFVSIGSNNEMQRYVVANGNAMSIVTINQEFRFEKGDEYYAFQKPIMRVRYDQTRERLVAGGLDNQLKCFSLENNEIKVAYKIKVPSEIFGLDLSSDGNHFALGLSNGSLIIKSKLMEKVEEQDEEEKLLSKILQPTYKSTSKNYKYFYRGQYIAPEIDDMIASQKQRKQKLQQYETFLKNFQYKKALSSAIQQKNPEIVVAVIEELIERGGLENALANRNEDEVLMVLDFIKWKIQDYRYQGLLIGVLRIAIDMYSGVMGGLSKRVDKVISEISKQLESEVEISSNLKQIQGQLDMMLRMVQFTTQTQ